MKAFGERGAVGLVLIAAALGGGCEETPLVEFETSCPRTDLPACSLDDATCIDGVWRYFLCLSERPDAPRPIVEVQPLEARWPVRSLSTHRFALETLGLWGVGEPPFARSSSVTGGRILLSSAPTRPELGAAFSSFVDTPRLGRPESLPTFAESLDRRARKVARAEMYRAFMAAARDGGSYTDHLPGLPRTEFEIAQAIRNDPAPLAALIESAELEALAAASRALSTRRFRAMRVGGIRAMNELLDAPRESPLSTPLSFALGRPLRRPPLPAGWPAPREERLGPDLIARLLGRSPFLLDGELLVSGEESGRSWFLWKVELQNLAPFAEEIELEGPSSFVVTSTAAFVIGASQPTIPDLRAIANAWLNEP